MPLYEFECPDCGSRTEMLYLTSREAPRSVTCTCGQRQARVPSRFSADFGADKRQYLRENGLEIGTRDEISKHAAERRAEADRKFDRQASEVIGATLAEWSQTNPGLLTD